MSKTVRCTRCAAEFTDSEIQDAMACPSCGSKGVPCSIAQDVDVRMNWHELRILVVWAEHYEETLTDLDSHGVVEAIATRLMKYRPAAAPPLRLLDEISDIQDIFPTAELVDGTGKVIVPKRSIQ